MKLNQAIAQKIVQRAMKIIPYSINVMNEDGIIIASGDPARLNQRHTGAVLVLRHHQPVEVDEARVKQWFGEVKKGINLPIWHLDKLIGVVGISGEPSEVKPFAELVKMTAELIVEQHFLLEKERWQHRFKEDFLLRLLQGSMSAQEQAEQASFFQFDLKKSYCVAILYLPNSHIETLQILVEFWRNQFEMVTIAFDKIALLIPTEQLDALLARQAVKTLLPSNIDFKNLRVAIGLPTRDATQFPLAYQTALHTLSYGLASHPKKYIYHYSAYQFPVLFDDFLHSWQAQELLEPAQVLNLPENSLLKKTLKQFFSENCDLARTSEKLFIHTNTLRYRLNKIEQLTSLKINQLEDKFILFLSSLEQG